MGKSVTITERALTQIKRQKKALTLVCPTCGASNKPGRSVIDLDEYDDARCEKCQDVWQVTYEAL